MLRQVHIFHKANLIFTYNYAIALGIEELENVKQLIESYLQISMPGKTLHRPISHFQIFHRPGANNTYFLFVADSIDSIDYVDDILKKTQNKFKELFPNPEEIKKSTPAKNDLLNFLNQIQKDLHSKITIAGPLNSGKTKLYDLLKSGEERQIMNFAKSSNFTIDNLSFDIWSFQLKDNFSLLWPKFIGGSDLVIVLFDASNFNLKTIEHFLNFQYREGKYSKFLVIANKGDLVSQEDIMTIKNELKITDLKVINLNRPNAKVLILQIIREALNLKKTLPSNFGNLIKEAGLMDKQDNVIGAIAKYKELILICNEYQDYSCLNTFQEKLDELQTRRNKQIELEKEEARKEKFLAPDQIKFTKKVSIKSLPNVKPLPAIKPRTPAPELLPTPIKTTSVKQTVKLPNLKLKPEDIKINIRTEEVEEIPKLDNQEIVLPDQFIPQYKNITDNIVSEEGFDFAKELQKRIEKNGGSLNIRLCIIYIEEMLNTLQRPLTIEDLNLAAKSFIEKENQG